MDTATGVKKQDYSATLISKFNEDNKNLSLNEKIDLVEKGEREERLITGRSGMSDNYITLYWHYKELRDKMIHLNLRSTFKGISYEEAISIITSFKHKLERECQLIKITDEPNSK